MRRLCTAVLALANLLLPTLSPAAMLASQFGRRYGALEIFDPQSKLSFRVNMPRLSEALPPCSTYLIPHFAIALGTGVLKDSDSRIAFDPAKHPDSANWPASWKRDQTFDTALKDSVQWYAQELSTRIGSARLQQNLKRIKYGNADLSGGLDKFWMSSSLRVTSFQQLDFLRNFREGKLGFNRRITKALQEAMVIERTPDYSLYGKYGSCPMPDGSYIGWLVGYAERGGKVWYYALNLDGKSLAEFAGARLQIVKGSLQELGFIPGTPEPPVPVPRPEVTPVAPAAPAAQTAPRPE
ncbi:MAG: class D beta-lactamase [Rhodanobacteraceae bacterium]|nr:class D beta-lactamase [Rhodanobacteraceae bacterium]